MPGLQVLCWFNADVLCWFNADVLAPPYTPPLHPVPDMSAVFVPPWKPEVAWVASDLFLNGIPFEQSPRPVQIPLSNR